MKLLIALINWYVIMGLRAEMLAQDGMGYGFFAHSHVRIREDVDNYFQMFSQKLSEVLRDYVLSAAAEEVDSAVGNNSNVEILWPRFGYSNCSQKIVANVLIKAFEDFYWTYNYGGPAWGAAVRTILIPNNVLFIDTIVDIQHNTGSVFNKEYKNSFADGFEDTQTEDAFMDFLNVKFMTNFIELAGMYPEALWVETKDFIFRFRNLYVVPDVQITWCCNSHDPYNYNLVKWVMESTSAETENELFRYEKDIFNGTEIPIVRQVPLSDYIIEEDNLDEFDVEIINKTGKL